MDGEMSDLSAVKREQAETLGGSALKTLSERLMSGEFAPGDKLSLRSVAQMLNVSMTPVREAVNRLVADHALEVAPNRAVRVPILNIVQFRELTALRVDIEGAAAFRAASARDDADIKLMSHYADVFYREGQKPKPRLKIATIANQQLHFAIYRATKSPMLVDVIAGLWLKAGPILNLDMRSTPERLKSGHAIGWHADAVAAIRRGDGEAARAAIACDIIEASESMIARALLPR